MSNVQIGNDLYASYNNWTIDTANKVGDNFDNPNSYKDVSAFEVAKQGYSENPNDYKNAFLTLARGNVERYDIDKNGTIGYGEYVQKELDIYNSTYGTNFGYNEKDESIFVNSKNKPTADEEYEQNFLNNYFLMNFMGMDVNNQDNEIDENELAAFSSTLDAYKNIVESTDENGKTTLEYKLDGEIEPQALAEWAPVEIGTKGLQFNKNFLKPFMVIYQNIFNS